MKRKRRILAVLTIILTLTMGLSLLTSAEETAAETESTSETAQDEGQTAMKSADLVAEGYELMEGVTVPVGTTNKDLEVEGKEPKNAEKITIEGA